jgi:bacterioferritin-associated ferredoxin
MTSRAGSVCVSRCICRDVAFDALLPRAKAAGWTLTDLVRESGCGGQCGLCRPYLREMLLTGQTEFHELLPPDGTPRLDARGKS